jgi:hypothetical protein
MMIVMTLHKFFDDDVDYVLFDCNENNRELVFKRQDHGSLLLNKEDVVALAKEFNLVVYEKDTNL